jgi:hypothetical protein
MTQYNKKYYQENKDRILAQKQSYYQANKESIKNKAKIYYDNNIEAKLEYQKDYASNHKDEKRVYQKKYVARKRNSDPLFKLISNRRSRRYAILKNNKTSQSKELLGCTIQKWKGYLEQRFDENMTWDNYGTYWELDEIIPCSAWDLNDCIEERACWHYLNSQPLKVNLNISKGGANRKDYSKDKAQFLMILRALNII